MFRQYLHLLWSTSLCTIIWAGRPIKFQRQMVPSHAKQQAVELLRSLKTGARAPLAVVNDRKYIQHNLGVADGKPGILALLQLTLSNPSTRINPIRVFQDGDFVFIHMDYDFFGPKIGFDVFRFEDGHIVEHWDNLQVTPTGPNGAGHTMIDGPSQVRDLDKTAANKALIQRYVTEVLSTGRWDLAPAFFGSGFGRYVEHNPQASADGVATREALVKALPPGSNVCARIRHVLGEGNFVLTMCDGTIGTNATAFYDLYRVENGKIAEHWDVTEQVPPCSEWKNLNGKF